jgi:cytochrome P450
MAADCAASPSSSLRPYEHIDSLIYDALMRVFFGIVPEEDSSALFLDLYRTVDHHKLWHSPRRTRDAVSSIVALVRQQAERISRTTPGPSSSFLAEAIRNDPKLLADPIFIENFIYFLHIARRDLTGLCGWLLKMLCDHPERGLQIRRATEESTVASRAETAAGRFVAETLRLRQSEYLYRTTSDAIRFEGFLIPSGWLVRLCIRESHTRAEVFECPHDFDPDRFLGTTYSQQQYQPFGIYEHACMVVSVTGTISRIFVEQLVSGFDWAIVQDGPMEPGLRHHRHWRPSCRLRINLVEASLG